MNASDWVEEEFEEEEEVEEEDEFQSIGDPEVGRFSSIKKLRAAHTRLLVDQEKVAEEIGLIQGQVEDLLARGARTGLILDESQDRWEAQSLLDYWYNVLYRAGIKVERPRLDKFDAEQLPSLADSRCPYLGLSAFREEDSDLYFGRRKLLDLLLQRFDSVPLLAVVGASGSGKSSIIRAALIPLLRGDRGHSDREAWTIPPVVLPGSTPLESLARALISHENETRGSSHPDDGSAATELAARMRLHPATLSIRLASDRGSLPVLLVFDQFEEVFTLCTDLDEVNAFFDNILRFVLGSGPPKRRVILTMRSDFEVHIMKYPAFRKEFERGRIAVTPLERDELRDAIEKPAKTINLVFERGVVDKLIEDTYGERGALPLLQFALLRLWRDRWRNKVTMEAYQELGGARLALANVADSVFKNLIGEDQEAAKRIFLRMVRPSEGLEVTNRRIALEDLYPPGEDHDRTRKVLGRLIAEGLIRETRGLNGKDPQVELAHEALVRNWPRLVDWLNNLRAAIVARQRLEAKVSEWVRRGRGAEAQLDTIQIDEASRWLQSPEGLILGAIPDLKALIDSSEQAIRQEQEDLRKSRRSAQLLGLIVAALVLFALGSMLSYQAAWKLEAVPKELLSDATNLGRSKPDALELKALLATEALERIPGVPSTEVRQVLLDTISQLPTLADQIVTPDGDPIALALDRTDRYLAVATEAGWVALYEKAAKTGKWTAAWAGPIQVDRGIFSLSFSPNGDRLVAVVPDPASVLATARAAMKGSSNSSINPSFSSDQVGATSLVATLRGSNEHANRDVVTGSSITVFDWTPGAHEEPRKILIKPPVVPSSAIFSEDGKTFYIAGWDNTIWRANAIARSGFSTFSKAWPIRYIVPVVTPASAIPTTPPARQTTEEVDRFIRPERGDTAGLIGFNPDGLSFSFPEESKLYQNVRTFFLHSFADFEGKTIIPTELGFNVYNSIKPFGPILAPNPNLVYSVDGKSLGLYKGLQYAVTIDQVDHRPTQPPASSMPGSQPQLAPIAPAFFDYGNQLPEESRILAISSDRRFLATVPESISTSTNTTMAASRAYPTVMLLGSTNLTIRQSGELGRVQFLSGSATSLHIINRSNGQLIGRVSHDAAITAAQFEVGGQRLVTVGRDHLIKIWKIDLIPTSLGLDAPNLQSATFSPDGTRLAIADSDPIKAPVPAPVSVSTTQPVLQAVPKPPLPTNHLRIVTVPEKKGNGHVNPQELKMTLDSPLQSVQFSAGGSHLIASRVPLIPSYPLPWVFIKADNNMTSQAIAPQAVYQSAISSSKPDANSFSLHLIDAKSGQNHQFRQVGPVAASAVIDGGDQFAASSWLTRATVVNLESVTDSASILTSGPLAGYATRDGETLVTIDWDHSVQIWRRQGLDHSLTPYRRISNEGMVSSFVFSQDDSRFAYAILHPNNTSKIGTSTFVMKVVETATGKVLLTSAPMSGFPRQPAIDRQGNRIAVPILDGLTILPVMEGPILNPPALGTVKANSAIVYDPESNRLVDAAPDVKKHPEQRFWYRHFEFSPDNRQLFVLGDNLFAILDLESQTMMGPVDGSDAVSSLFSPLGSYLAVKGFRETVIYRLPEIEPVFKVVGNHGWSNLMQFADNDQELVYVDGRTIRKISMEQPRGPGPPVGRKGWAQIGSRLVELEHLLNLVTIVGPTNPANLLPSPHRKLRIDERCEILRQYLEDPQGPNGRDALLLDAGLKPGAISVADRDEFKRLIAEIVVDPVAITGVKIVDELPSGSEALILGPGAHSLTLSHGKDVGCWSVANQKWISPPKMLKRELSTYHINRDGRTAVDLSLTGRTLINDSLGKPRAILLNDEPVYALAYSPDGRLLATGSLDAHVRIFDTQTHQEITSFVLGAPISGLSFSTTGAWLATIGGDNAVSLWSIDDLSARTQWDQSPTPASSVQVEKLVIRVAFSHDDQTLAISCGDGSLQLQEIISNRSGTKLAPSITYQRSQADYATTFDRDDNSILYVGFPPSFDQSTRDAMLFTLPYSKHAILKAADTRITRNFDREEWEKYLAGMPYRRTVPSLRDGEGVDSSMIPNLGQQLPIVLILLVGFPALFLLVIPARKTRESISGSRWLPWAIAVIVGGLGWGLITTPMIWTDSLAVSSPLEKLTIAAILAGLSLLCAWLQPRLIRLSGRPEGERPFVALTTWLRENDPYRIEPKRSDVDDARPEASSMR